MLEAASPDNAEQRNPDFDFCEGCFLVVPSLPRGIVNAILFRQSKPGPSCMPDVFVAKAAQFPDGERRIVRHGATEIGVFHWQGRYYAYENLCVHQGGPACEGVMMHKVEDVIAPDKTWSGQKFSKDEIHFVCPWHGYEYDLKTGECAADRKLRLKSFEVVKRGEDVYVVAG
jgi:nitrite reductase/ring-hydroxylating ferredoxin subunit